MSRQSIRPGMFRRWLALPIAVVFVVGTFLVTVLSLAGTPVGTKVVHSLPVAYRWALGLPVPARVVVLAVAVGVLVIVLNAIVQSLRSGVGLYRDRVRHGRPLTLTREGAVEEIRQELGRTGAEMIHAIQTRRALPAEVPLPTSLIGRDAELSALVGQLETGHNIAVSGRDGERGIGKSALAAKAADTLNNAGAFPGGVYWLTCVNLFGASGLDELCSRAAQLLGLGQLLQLPEAQRPARLRTALLTREPVLFVLDNVEPQLGIAKVLDLLAVTGHAAVLVTSVDPVGPDRRISNLVLQPLAPGDAERMLREELHRLRAGAPDAAFDPDTIRRMAAGLRGLPLLIRFAAGLAAGLAARGSLTLEQVVATQEHIGTVGVDHPDFGRLDLIWNQLSAAEQRLFAGLALIREESFSIEEAYALARAAAASVAVGAGDPTTTDPATDFGSLINYQLIIPLYGDASGRLYRLHHESRTFAKRQLAGQPDPVRDGLIGATVRYWETQLATAYAADEYGEVMNIARAVSYNWDAWGRRDELQHLLEWIRDHDSGPLPSEVLWARLQLAELYRKRGRTADAVDLYQAVDKQAGEMGASLMALQARRGLAEIAFEQADFDRAERTFEQTLDQARAVGDLECQLLCLHGLGTVELVDKVRYDYATERFDDALKLAIELNYTDAQARELRWKARVLVEQAEAHEDHAEAAGGDLAEYQEARELAQQSLAIARDRYHLYNIGKAYQLLGRLSERTDRATGLDEYRMAARALSQAQASAPEIAAVRQIVDDLESSRTV
jgi:tetratricopeptide (TPR) repeat protein